MSNIEFESDNMNFKRPGSPQGSGFVGGQNKGMVGWLVAHGIVRSENIGQMVLIAFVAFNFIASFVLLKYFGVF